MKKIAAFILILCITSVYVWSQPYAANKKMDSPQLTGNLLLDSKIVSASDSSENFLSGFFNETPKRPFKAAVMSAIIPGTGEIYSESYISAASFFTAEIIFLSTFYYYNNLANEREKDFQKIANDPVNGWFVDKYASYLIEMAGRQGVNAQDLIGAMEQDGYNHYFSPDNSYDAPGNRSYWNLLNDLEGRLTYEDEYGNAFSHKLPHYGEQQYYELIGKYDQFSPGWGDFTGETGMKASAAFLSYRDMRTKANNTHDLANTLLIAVFLNHAASAVNAALQANWYNKNLHVSLLHRKLIDENWYAANLSFTF